MTLDWRKWGLGGSISFDDPTTLRLWLGPVRVGWAYGHTDDSMRCDECKGSGRVTVDTVSIEELLP